MRWKLLIVVVLAATAVGLGAWLAVIIGIFGPATNFARQPLWFSLSLTIPIFFAVFSAFFVYRHTAKHRRLQALLTAMLTLVLTAAMYVFAERFWNSRFTYTQIETQRGR